MKNQLLFWVHMSKLASTGDRLKACLSVALTARTTWFWVTRVAILLSNLSKGTRDPAGASFQWSYRYVVSGVHGCRIVPRYTSVSWKQQLQHGENSFITDITSFVICIFVSVFLFFPLPSDAIYCRNSDDATQQHAGLWNLHRKVLQEGSQH